MRISVPGVREDGKFSERVVGSPALCNPSLYPLKNTKVTATNSGMRMAPE